LHCRQHLKKETGKSKYNTSRNAFTGAAVVWIILFSRMVVFKNSFQAK
jgi:hypothetical protein